MSGEPKGERFLEKRGGLIFSKFNLGIEKDKCGILRDEEACIS